MIEGAESVIYHLRAKSLKTCCSPGTGLNEAETSVGSSAGKAGCEMLFEGDRQHQGLSSRNCLDLEEPKHNFHDCRRVFTEEEI